MGNSLSGDDAVDWDVNSAPIELILQVRECGQM